MFVRQGTFETGLYLEHRIKIDSSSSSSNSWRNFGLIWGKFQASYPKDDNKHFCHLCTSQLKSFQVLASYLGGLHFGANLDFPQNN